MSAMSPSPAAASLEESAPDEPREDQQARRQGATLLGATADRGEGALALDDPLEELPRVALGEALLPLRDIVDIGVNAAGALLEIHTLLAAGAALPLWLPVGAPEHLTSIADPSRGDPAASICGD